MKKEKETKSAIKYGIIGFVLAALLFIMIPGGSDNVTTDLMNNGDTSQQEFGETNEAPIEDEPEAEYAEAENTTEPVVEVKKSVDWSKVIITQKTDTLEYSKKTTDPLKLISCDDKGVTIDTDYELDLRETGKHTIVYTLSKNGETKDVKLVFRVKDTKKPKIFFHYKEPKIEIGEYFDPINNIASVKDPVDGSLRYTSEERPGKGEYAISGYYDTNAKGNYEIKVTAKDKNGKVKTRTFKLKVKAPINVSTNASGSSGYYDSTSQDTGSDYIINTNTGKFHHTWCGSVSQMANHNKWSVHMTREEIIAMGYVPCKNCNP